MKDDDRREKGRVLWGLECPMLMTVKPSFSATRGKSTRLAISAMISERSVCAIRINHVVDINSTHRGRHASFAQCSRPNLGLHRGIDSSGTNAIVTYSGRIGMHLSS